MKNFKEHPEDDVPQKLLDLYAVHPDKHEEKEEEHGNVENDPDDIKMEDYEVLDSAIVTCDQYEESLEELKSRARNGDILFPAAVDDTRSTSEKVHDAVRGTINNRVTWPKHADEGMYDFNQDQMNGILVQCVPVLFPDGKCDYTASNHVHKVKQRDAINFYTKFSETALITEK